MATVPAGKPDFKSRARKTMRCPVSAQTAEGNSKPIGIGESPHDPPSEGNVPVRGGRWSRDFVGLVVT